LHVGTPASENLCMCFNFLTVLFFLIAINSLTRKRDNNALIRQLYTNNINFNSFAWRGDNKNTRLVMFDLADFRNRYRRTSLHCNTGELNDYTRQQVERPWAADSARSPLRSRFATSRSALRSFFTDSRSPLSWLFGPLRSVLAPLRSRSARMLCPLTAAFSMIILLAENRDDALNIVVIMCKNTAGLHLLDKMHRTTAL